MVERSRFRPANAERASQLASLFRLHRAGAHPSTMVASRPLFFSNSLSAPVLKIDCITIAAYVCQTIEFEFDPVRDFFPVRCDRPRLRGDMGSSYRTCIRQHLSCDLNG